MQKRVYNKEKINKLLVVKKPMFISSNHYLNRVKREYKNKKAGFSGTLDPFACGTLIVAFGQYLKLFNYMDKTPKRYKATLWLGLNSLSLDIENIVSIKDEKRVDLANLQDIIHSLKGEIEYTPPKYSAKKLDGKRAYSLAREGKEFELKKSLMTIYDIKLLNYNHPFVSFEASVSEGSYIRSIAEIIAQKLNCTGALSYLERLNEGKFFYENQKSLNPLDFISLKRNSYSGTKQWIEYGRSIDIEYLSLKDNGKYIIEFDDFFSIIEIENKEVKYLLNKVANNV